ncbi:MAG: serine/threonine-protein kinase [Hyalangium sp.]|uniref:serine/threonine-protein kinase n=1 Tax=Hyalangium sp. TaxID=2028555 RepID=UPI00389A3B4D
MTDEQTPDSLRPGSAVGPWLIEGHAGRGTYGAVFRARRAGLPGSVPVALKVAVFAYDPRFLREVELLSRTRHPSVPQLLDRGWWTTDSGRVHPYLVMEWVNGLPLYEWARAHPPSCRRVLQVVAQVAWGLEALHSAGGLHRDVKGDNILVEPEGRALLTDFGSGTWAGAPPLTDSLMPPGTREYRAPEALRFQWRHLRQLQSHYQARTFDDLYALGVSVYRLVTGLYPPPGTDPEARLDPFRFPPPLPPLRQPPQKLNPRVIPELAALIEQMLAAEPEARGLARDVAQAADAAAERAGSEADGPLMDPPRPSATAVAVPVRVQAEAQVPPAVSKPGPIRPEAPEVDWGLRIRRVLVVGLLLAIPGSILWMGHGPYSNSPTFPPRESADLEWDRDGAETSLADASVPASVSSPQSASGSASIALQMPDEPLPGQRRPPCRPREEAIRGGCWVRLNDNFSPPCDDESYVWQGSCYIPKMERTRTPTSKDPQK